MLPVGYAGVVALDIVGYSGDVELSGHGVDPVPGYVGADGMLPVGYHGAVPLGMVGYWGVVIVSHSGH